MKTMQQIRDILSEQLDDLRKKKTTPAVANAICNTTGKIFVSVRLEIEAMKLSGKDYAGHFLKLTSGK